MSVTSDFDDYFLANPLISEIRKGNIDEACVDEKSAQYSADDGTPAYD